jgi:uncharacterized membrane protein
MSLKQVVKREAEVAFSKGSQPVWFRVVKYIVLTAFFYFFWDRAWLWQVFGGFLVFALVLHFWYRYKTKGWTQSYGMWKHESERNS